MKEATQQYSDITYNTFADVIDWDDLTEKDYQTIQELKENGITITPDTVIEDLSGFPVGEAPNKVTGIFANKKHLLSNYLTKMPHGLVDKKIPGIGATTLEINSKRNWRALKKEQTTSLSFLSWRMILSSKLKSR